MKCRIKHGIGLLVLIYCSMTLPTTAHAKTDMQILGVTVSFADTAKRFEDSSRTHLLNWGVGTAHTLVGSAAFGLGMYSLFSPTYLDTLSSPSESVAVISLVSSIASAAVVQVFGDYVLDGDGSFGTTLIGAAVAALISTRLSIRSEGSFLRRILLLLPPGLGAFLGYVVSSTSYGVGFELIPGGYTQMSGFRTGVSIRYAF